jgi:hypothetical protein
MKPRTAVTRRPLPSSPFNKAPVDLPPAEVYAVDDLVSHDRYGLGTVVGTEGVTAVIVNFGADTRRINIPNPKLSRLESDDADSADTE